MKCLRGFTLIEVLLAMVIVAVAFTAIIKVSSQNQRNIIYLEQKTIANWVALQAIKSAQADLIPVREQANTVWEKTRMLNREWYWQLRVKPSTIAEVSNLTVAVYDKPDGKQLITLSAPYRRHINGGRG